MIYFVSLYRDSHHKKSLRNGMKVKFLSRCLFRGKLFLFFRISLGGGGDTGKDQKKQLHTHAEIFVIYYI